jgi:hypothetical protein
MLQYFITLLHKIVTQNHVSYFQTERNAQVKHFGTDSIFSHYAYKTWSQASV